ncbi:MAG: reverse transcriptase domain-containing protein [Candidatus Absconditabacteria bacterium]|nr:reverse transcriptase domain-containing protein [Candidatus Absconditabacteria bacterium]MDD3868531.1 reverse transcriptase domain-containing protein [Candidatus Absconditabacteria bacterium]MDD4714095.1 reverse transcriptase domain-containing protein [Candidatus Absconditabacteria bacterium]
MEEGCILSDKLLQELAKEDNIVLESLAKFCKCSKKELIEILESRNKELSEQKYRPKITFGYKKYQKKVNNKLRELREPTPALKKIQETIRKYLMYIPVSLSSTAGTAGDSPEKGAEQHRYNPYLITLDIKNSYPSIDTQRVYKNLEGALGKALDIRCPLLETTTNKELFLKAITHLCVSENELPQGASTSNQIQNIVMKGFDNKIEKKLPELISSHAIYSRYADDLTISFRHYITRDVLQEKIDKYIEILNDENKQKFQNLMESFPNERFIVTDNHERKYINKQIKKVNELIQNSPLFTEEEKYDYIGVINTYKQRIEYSNRRIDYIKDELIKIIGQEGRTINQKKIKVRTPQSNNEREINGICFDEKGNKSLNKQKQGQYKRLFRELFEKGIDELKNNSYYARKFKLGNNHEADLQSIEKIKATLKGTYSRIKRVYGEERIPKEFKELFDQNMGKREDYPTRQMNQKKLETEDKKEEEPLNINNSENRREDDKDDLPF